jgi:hypothetical protein
MALDIETVAYALTALGVAIAAATLYVTYRYAHRKPLLLVDFRNIRLVPVLVEFDNKIEELKPNPPNQWIVQVRIVNRGPIDITKTAFSDEPLSIWLGSEIVRLTTHNVAPPLDVTGRSAQIPPQRIPVGANWQWSVQVVNKEPWPLIHSPLADVRVRVRVHKGKDGHGMGLPGMMPGFRSKWMTRGRVFHV